jgi:hypothetical protein
MGQPYQIVVGPVVLYTAPVGEAYPDSQDTPGGNWARLGSASGIFSSHSEEGVSIELSQAVTKHRVDGETLPVKATRQEEDTIIRVNIFDLTPANFTKYLAGTSAAAVAASSGVPGSQTLGLTRGLVVYERALLIRGAISPNDDGSGLNLQWEFPRVFQNGNATIVHNKVDKAGLAFEWHVLIDLSASTADQRGGRFISQTAAQS